MLNTNYKQNDAAPPELMTAKQLRQALNICSATLTRLRHEGIPCVYVGTERGIGARGVRYSLPDVLRWLKCEK